MYIHIYIYANDAYLYRAISIHIYIFVNLKYGREQQ